MVDVPYIRQTAVSQGSASQVSGGYINSAFQQLAQGLDSLAEQAGAQSQIEAGIEGENAVYTDKNGTLTYSPRSNFTASGRAFNKTAGMSWLSQTEAQMGVSLAQMEADSNGSIPNFDKVTADYSKKLLASKPPIMAGPLKTLLAQKIGAQREGMVRRQTAITLKTQEDAIRAKLELANEDAAALAASGGTDTKEYKAKIADIHAILDTLTGNPGFMFSKDQAEVTLRRMQSDHTGEAINGQVQRIYQKDGLKAATEYANKAFDDPSLPLSPADRRKYQNIAITGLRAARAENAEALKAARAGAKAIRDAFKGGVSVRDEDVQRAANELSAAGQPGEALLLWRQFHNNQQIGFLGKLPDEQQLQILETARSGVSAGPGGAGGMRNVVSARQKQLEFILQEFGTSEAAAGARLRNAGSLEEAVQAGLAYERASIPAFGKRLNNARRVLAGTASPEAMQAFNFFRSRGFTAIQAAGFVGSLMQESGQNLNPGAYNPNDPGGSVGIGQWNRERRAALEAFAGKGAYAVRGGGGSHLDPAVMKALNTDVASDANRMLDMVEKGLKSGAAVDPYAIETLGRQAAAIGDEDFTRKVRDLVGLYGAGQESVAQLDAAIAAAGPYDQDSALLLDGLNSIRQSTVEGLKSDPVYLGERRGVGNIQPLDFSKPVDQLANDIHARQVGVNMIQHTWEVADIPALTANEINTVQSLLGRLPAAEGAKLLNALSTNLSHDNYMATMAKVGEQTSPAMMVAGGLYARDPQIAESILRGEELLKQTPTLGPDQKEDTKASIQELMPYTAFAPSADLNQAREGFIAAATARYADLSAASGDVKGVYSEERMKQAIKDVTGGFVQFNTKDIFPPDFKMDQQRFDRIVENLSPRDVAGAQTLNGRPISVDEVRQHGILRGIGEGRYLIQLSNDFGITAEETAPYVLGPDHRLYVLDLTQETRDARSRLPPLAGFTGTGEPPPEGAPQGNPPLPEFQNEFVPLEQLGPQGPQQPPDITLPDIPDVGGAAAGAIRTLGRKVKQVPSAIEDLAIGAGVPIRKKPKK